MIAAVTCDPGSRASRSGGGAGTWSGSRLSWTGCTIILPGRRFSCSLLPFVLATGVQRGNQHGQTQQVRRCAQRPRAAAAARGCVGPRHRDQPLGAIRQDHQQLACPVPAHAAQHRQQLAFEGMPWPGDPHGVHRRPCPPASRAPRSPQPAVCNTAAAASAALPASRPVTASRRSTGTPAAKLAAICSPCPPLPGRARQRTRLQRVGHRRKVDRRHHQAAGIRGKFDRDSREILAGKPRTVPDQQLNGRLQAQQALRPRPQPGREVIEARSKAGVPLTRFRIRH